MKKRKVKRSGYPGKRAPASGPLIACFLCLLLAAVCYFAVPGMKFSGILFLGVAGLCGLCTLLQRWAERSRAGKRCKIVFLAALYAGLVTFAFVEAQLIRAGSTYTERADGQSPDAVIVLGAGVNGAEPSLILQSRVDTAADYLEGKLLFPLSAVSPTVPVLLSGGQGPGEDCSEAQAMYTALTAQGVAEERLILEEASSNTAENLDRCAALLRERGIDSDGVCVAIVTSEFHVLRSGLLARREGMNVLCVPARTPHWWLRANGFAREFFALGKLAAENLF